MGPRFPKQFALLACGILLFGMLQASCSGTVRPTRGIGNEILVETLTEQVVCSRRSDVSHLRARTVSQAACDADSRKVSRSLRTHAVVLNSRPQLTPDGHVLHNGLRAPLLT